MLPGIPQESLARSVRPGNPTGAPGADGNAIVGDDTLKYVSHWRDVMRLFGAVAAILIPVALSAQDTGYVKARGKPGSAAVFINGKYIGPAERFTVPEKYATPAGEAEVTLREPRYEEYTTKVTVAPRKTATIHYKLTKLPVPEPPFGRFRLGGGENESFLSV